VVSRRREGEEGREKRVGWRSENERKEGELERREERRKWKGEEKFLFLRSTKKKNTTPRKTQHQFL
jgi:hypothetical protein